MIRTIVAQAPDGSQVLVTIHEGATEQYVEVATRPEVGAIWGPPLEVVGDEVS